VLPVNNLKLVVANRMISSLIIINNFTGAVKAVLGATLGGAIGLILFKSGSGWRSACMAVGVGAAVGNTYERILKASPASVEPKPPN
jgi:hypothetical protein